MEAPSPAFRRLALVTGVATFLLILVGGVVRVSDSGLGCGPAGSGFHGWPLCTGDVIPGLDLRTVIEFSHRLLAGAVGVMMLLLAGLAWRRYRRHRSLVRAATFGTGLVIAQGLLGAATVEHNLDPALVATHLGLAMVILALVLYVWRASRPDVIGAAADGGGPRLRVLAVAASAAILATIVAGGYMAGTQNYGRADYRLGDGAHHACGKEFPTCNGDFMPFGQARLVDIHLTHRALMYLATALVVALAVMVLRRRPSRGLVVAAWTALGLLTAQILLGALNVWLDEYRVLIAMHLALATLLWGHLVGMTMRLYPVPAPSAEEAGRRDSRAPEAATA